MAGTYFWFILSLLSSLILKRMPKAGKLFCCHFFFSPVHSNNFKIQNPPVVCFLRIYVLAASTFRGSESPIPKDAHHRPSTPPRCRVPPEAERPVIWISGCVTYRRISNLKKCYTGGFKSKWQRQSWNKWHSDRPLHAARAEPIECFNRSSTQPLRRESWNCYCAQEKEQQKSVPASGVLF